MALLADETLRAVDEGRAPGRAVRIVHEAGVERRVDGEWSIAQRTVGGGGIEIGPNAGKAIFRGRRRRLRGRQHVGGVGYTGDAKSCQCREAKRFHDFPPQKSVTESPVPRPPTRPRLVEKDREQALVMSQRI